jgi:hypothetical protein
MERLPLGRVELCAGVILTLWALALHFVWLKSAGPLWRDEVGTIDFAGMPTWGEIWRNLQYDNFPPLFVAVARAWMGLGFSSDFGCRVLGFLIGAVTLAVLWWSARCFGARAPLLAVALYGLNPMAIRVGDSMRPYGFGILLTLLALALVWRFAQSQQTKWLVLATAASVLSVQCLYQCAFFVMAFCCGAWAGALAGGRRKAAMGTAILAAISAISLLPHVSNIKKGQDWFVIARTQVPADALLKMLASALNDRGGWTVVVWLGLGISALAVAFLLGGSRRVPQSLYLAASMIVWTVAFAAFLQFLGLTPRSWYFLILMAPAALAMDGVFGSLAHPVAQAGRIGLAVLLAACMAPNSWAGVRMRQSNIDFVAAKIKSAAQPGDMVLVSPWYYGVSLQRYLPTNSWTALPPMTELRTHRYDLMKKQMEAPAPIALLLAGAENALRSGHALWVAGVFQFAPSGQPQPILPPYHGEPMDAADAHYFSSWMFQISALVQSHAKQGGQVAIASPDNLPINPFEDVPLLRFEGWHD